MEKELLHGIDSPTHLKGLSLAELKQLAQELRDLIIGTVAKTGGHLASNLGVVELTLALLYCYNPPFDKIIWDVGHQVYPYKLLTHRRQRFSTLRSFQGISGFPKRSESVYDMFGAGHSSTSISAGYGFAKARDLKQLNHHVLSIIGDGSITNGLAYEGLNNAGQDGQTDFTVILNANEMSISKNVGSISLYLNRVITSKYYNRIKNDIMKRIKSFPEGGESIYKLLRRIEENVKGIILPANLFEDMGFRYIGPIDGHNLQALITTLNNIKRLKQPKLVHIITKKGKGYAPAEQDPTTFHSAKPFVIETGTFIKKSGMSFSKAFGRTMVLLSQHYQNIVGVSAAMVDGTGFKAYKEQYPERFFDVGIAEGHALTFAAGLAAEGYKPIVAIYSTFMQRTFDQLIHDIALQNLPVVVCMDRAGLVGEDGPTHHGVFDIPFTMMVPNMVVMAPKDEEELKDLLYTAYFIKQPCSLRYPKGGTGKGLSNEFPRKIPLGEWEVLTEGRDVALLAVGSCVQTAEKAAENLQAAGVSTMVVNCRFLKPMDEALLQRLAEQNMPIITLEEGARMGGFGMHVLERCRQMGRQAGGTALALPDRFIEHGKRDILLAKYGLDADAVVKQTLALLGKPLSEHESKSSR